jgi:hypothetical protein
MEDIPGGIQEQADCSIPSDRQQRGLPRVRILVADEILWTETDVVLQGMLPYNRKDPWGVKKQVFGIGVRGLDQKARTEDRWRRIGV